MANLDGLFGKKASRIVLGTASDSFIKGEDQSKILDEAFDRLERSYFLLRR